MPRRVEDIIPSNRRSIRDIPIERNRKKTSRAKEKDDEEVVPIHVERTKLSEKLEEEPVEEVKPTPRKKKRAKKSLAPVALTLVALVLVVAGISFGVSGHFARATFHIVPKSTQVSVSGTYTIPPSSEKAFGYETITLTGTATTSVPSTKGTYTESKATGKVILYNTYSAQSQKLVAGTRVANDSGLIYRLSSTVVIPGYTKSGSTVAPGSVSAGIVADQAGPTYNIGGSDSVSDFKVVAYKGTTKYNTIYGRLSSPVTGGFAGTKIDIAKNTLASTTLKLQQEIVATLVARALSAVPAEYITFDGMQAATFDTLKIVSQGTTTSVVSLQGSVSLLTLNKIKLARLFAGASSTAPFGSIGYVTSGLDTLNVTFSNKNDFSIAKASPVIIKAKGGFSLVGSVTSDELTKALKGTPIDKSGDILRKYASVIDLTKTQADISPPWVRTIPLDTERISVSIDPE